MTTSLERCFNHAARGAAARCLACTRFFCRECITEHGGRVLCTPCLTRRLGPSRGASNKSPLWLYALAACANLLVLYALFYGLGALLLRLPSSFHDGSLLGAELEP